MCVVSMVGDHYAEKFKPWIAPKEPWRVYPDDGPYKPMEPNKDGARITPPVSREEFDQLKKEVEEMKALLKRAKEYDERNGEPDCEIEDKMALLRKIAEAVGISLDDVIGKAA